MTGCMVPGWGSGVDAGNTGIVLVPTGVIVPKTDAGSLVLLPTEAVVFLNDREGARSGNKHRGAIDVTHLGREVG